MEEIGFIIFQGMEIVGANAEANQFVAGFPAVTGFTGFAHWLERQLNEAISLSDPIWVEGIAIIGHWTHFHETRPKVPASLTGSKFVPSDPTKFNPPIVDEVKMDLRLSLILRLVSSGKKFKYKDKETILDYLSSEGRLSSLVQGRLVCGGTCQSIFKTQFLESDFSIEKKWWEYLPSDGYFLKNRMDTLKELLSQDEKSESVAFTDPMQALLDTCFVYREEGKAKRQQKGWLIPIAVGYQALEAGTIRRGTRKTIPHVYAEPLTSLGEFWHVKRFLEASDNEKAVEGSGLFWVHCHDETANLYYTRTL